jgi:hypothetical protein
MNGYGIRRFLAVLATVTMAFALLVTGPMSSPVAAAKPPTRTPTGPMPSATPTAPAPGGVPGGCRTSGSMN